MAKRSHANSGVGSSAPANSAMAGSDNLSANGLNNNPDF